MGRSRSRSEHDEKKEKKEKKKKRSRSSESAERSREREKRRRKEQLKNAKPGGGGGGGGAPGGALGGGPGAMPALGGIPGVSAGQQMFWDGFQWVPRASGDTGAQNVDATRKLRRLYLGNLPYHLGVTEDSFSSQFYQTLKERGLCNDSDQNPIQHVWFAREKGANYGFVEMASVEETERALGLDGMLVCGVPITIKRINDSVSPLASIGNIRPGMPPPAPGMPGGGGMLALPGVLATATSKIIVIKEILKQGPDTTEDDYKDVTEDMNEGCGAHGKLNKALIIRPNNKIQLPGPEYNIGDVFLECASIEDATKIMRAMGHRKYDGRQINMKSFDEDQFQRTVKAVVPN